MLKINNSPKLCFVTCSALLSLSSCAEKIKSDQEMNVLFLLIDDTRWTSLNCMGSDFMITPNIDALASDGVIFDNAYVTSAISCVSRASILTGQYMSRHNVEDFKTTIAEDEIPNTYPAQLRKAGYWTGLVGKYGVSTPRECDYDFLTNYDYIHWYPTDPKVKIKQLEGGYTKIEGDSIHVTRRNVKEVMEFFDSAPKDQPFCLSVGFYAPHAEDFHPDQYRYQPSSEKYYQDVTIPVPETADDEYLRRLPEFLQDPKSESRVRWHWRYDTPEKYQSMMKAYYRMITEVDIAVGEIIDRLKQEGRYENTLIVFMGDNGYFHSEHQLADKWYPYNEALRIPLIIHDPRIKKSERNRRIDGMVLNIDLAPTLLTAMGITPPESMQGLDLSPLYLGSESEIREDFYYEHPIIHGIDCIPDSEGLVTADKKYILWTYHGVEEYFDLEKDPLEVNNLFNDPAHQADIEAMKKRFEELKYLAK